MLAILERLDHQLFFAVNHGLSTLGLDYVFWVVSALGYGVVLVLLAGIGLWWRDRQTFKQHFGWLILAVLAGAGLVQILKFGCARPRPLGEFAALVQAGEVYINIIGRQLRYRSFPSGHAQAATSVVTYLLYLYPQRWCWWAGGIFLIGLSRLYVGVHFPSDVFVGMLIGSLSVVGALYLQRRQNVLPAAGGRPPAE